MNELDMPPTRPLPADVRERALSTVRAGMDAPAHRKLPPLLAAAAAVVAALTVTTMVAVSGPVEQVPGPAEPGLEQLASGPPVLSGDPRIDEALVRCADAVVTRGRTADYPPTDQWRATDVLLTSPGGDTAIAINDSFACFAGWSNMWVSSMHGTPAGTAAIARLAPAIVVVLNPERREIEIVPGDGRGAEGGAPDAPVQLMLLGSAGMLAGNYWLTVAGSYDDLMPEPGPIGVVVEDRPSTVPAPPTSPR
jgi:hypothetical protein